MIITKKFNQLSVNELYDILSLREEVFVVEQNSPYHDIDYKDKESIHMYMVEDKKIVSYIRLIPKPYNYKNSPSISRVATNKKYRGKGYSKLLIDEGIKYIFENFKENKIEISAMEYLISFYEKFGFKRRGEIYLEENLPHIHMVLDKK